MPDAETASIVMVGSFNPAIFQPMWLSSQGLVSREHAESAKIATIQNQISEFSTGSFWLQVFPERLTLQATDPLQYAPLRDLAYGIVGLLPHTPVKAVGLNRNFHMRSLSEDAWHRVGNNITPKNLWTPLLDRPGMLSLWMQGYRKGEGGPLTRVRIEPSGKTRPGVFVETNEEYKGEESETVNAQWISEILSRHWDSAMSYSEEVVTYVMDVIGK